jgi:hypothetical protein
MKASTLSWILIGVLLAGLLSFGGIVAAGAAGVKWLAPLRTTMDYRWSFVARESQTMNRCVSCHEPEHFHTCVSCHDGHGAVEMADVPFNALIALEGDVPKPAWIPINELLPYRDQPSTQISLLDLLAEHEVEVFESVSMASTDGGFVTVSRENLTPEALLMPHVDGVRFAAPNLHISTWLKGVVRIILVGPDKPLRIDGQPTSIGRLLVGPTVRVTVEQTDVMLKSPDDGQVRKAKTAGRIEGAPVSALVSDPDFDELVVRDASGKTAILSAQEAKGALLAQRRGQVVLVLPDRGQPQWIEAVVEISTR